MHTLPIRTGVILMVLLGLAGCNSRETVGQNINRNMDATGNALGRAADSTGNALGNAADSTGRALNNAGTATRDTLDPPRGPAERSGRAIDRATGTSY